VRLLPACALLAALGAASAAFAADADNGKRLAEARCAACHFVGAGQGRQVSNAPAFEAIARKLGSNPELLAFLILDPHPRMNMTITRRDAEDIAAYIGTLAR
jgi:mono/diheme cytochrome c family protein